ncbi:MAG: AlkA N-terminal domain-containing protein, partial [Acidobacteriota bacterium]
ARIARDARFDGRFFVAVTSTRIYCRPICPARTARRENVRYYRTAEEAAAAGFRPCLRCRPEAAPGTPAWHGSSSTVSRALRLISEGALQEGSVADLSARLGVSARHLDRLFQAHLGASPMAVANTRRLQFAKQLISDSDLPMSHVAAASGFRSVRRFNDSIRRLYGRPPSELRRLRPIALRSRPDEYVFRLPYRPPYDWDSLLAFLAVRAIPGVEEVVAGAYRRTFALEGRHGILEIRHEKKHEAIEARIRFPEPVSLLPIVSRLRDVLDLAADVTSISERFRHDPLLGPLVQRRPGLRVPGAWDPFELAVRAILGQQVSVAGATTLAGRIARSFGETLDLADAGGLAVVFPGPHALADANLIGMPKARALAIGTLARQFASEELLPGGPEEEFLTGLGRVKGVGAWTVEYVAMRALRHPDAFPASDLVLLRSAGRGRALPVRELQARSEAWRPWRAYAAIHLWRAAAEMASEVDDSREREELAALASPVASGRSRASDVPLTAER